MTIYWKSRIIELRNDLKAVTDELAIALQNVFNSPEPEPNAAEPATNGQAQSEALKEFARVDGVAPGSPANEAVRIPPFLVRRACAEPLHR